ncbi:glycoside hydrolase family 26 protein [Bacteroides intestinalis]|jgi:mannan endo-1,4-beta-mannosidase|uniref:Mannan endo-1,4-beta-mannosidase n=1 Tax=Bacteroides intestinalis TaxID=329854 RepID=A0A3E4KXH7_9BACE|nr:glycosyl hydrolase [Bacteroides intestinalis]QDO67752.1 beta-mannosidase [Bacteroides intestinalis]RGK25447.1 beta-mannosidase [Bacteroides intestinalis]RGT50610.1 beta-mannosidase [Bacteroides intestinalis]RGX84002.1 beta-mannosidase [Bacteroides intestinalis]UCB35982.1 beta-mannosidase [Bacteroides intestinalis]
MISLIMKNKKLLVAIGLVTVFAACSLGDKGKVRHVRTPETVKLLANLKKVSALGFMFGHHDDTNYGIGWDGEEGRSDVKSVCGDYPAVISFDLGHIELGDTVSLDNVPFSKIRREILNQYKRGGMSSLSWHLRNPLTGGDSWDVSDTTVVKSVLPGGSNHEKFTGWVSKVSAFINSLQTEDGVKVPVLFRPWHEHTGSWFWWGEKLCTPEEYKALWHMTVDILREDGVNNALYAYSPGSEPQDTVQYLKRYPGDDLVDVIGFDTYQFDRDSYIANLEKSLTIIDSIGKAHNKVIAITETGYEGIPDSKWWTGTLLPAIEKYPIAYVLVWRNARERVTHFYAPYPGQISADDFVEFYKHPKTLFAADVNSLYK